MCRTMQLLVVGHRATDGEELPAKLAGARYSPRGTSRRQATRRWV
jgi:hypothetical protein